MSSFYKRYLRSEYWRNFRKEALEHYGNKCSRCGATRDLNVHHLDYSTLGYESLKDVEVLCEDCHFDEHFDEILRRRCKHPRHLKAVAYGGKTVTLLWWCAVCNQAVTFRKATPEEIKTYAKKKIKIDEFCL